jgi:hypothetical protein
LEDDTTKKPVVPTVAPIIVTVAPIVAADKPVSIIVPVVQEPVKAEEVEIAVEANEIVAPIEAQNDEKVAEIVTEMMPDKMEVIEIVNDIVPAVESETIVAVVPEVVASQAPLADSPVTTPTKATSEEEGLLEGIINTLAFDDADDDGKIESSFLI